MPTRAQRWQYPAKTQPVQEVALPTLDWLVQHPDPVLAAPPRQAEGALVEDFAAPALPDIDWLVQQPDPVRRPPELVHEQLAFTRLIDLSEIPIGWVPQYPDPVRRPPELVGEQYAFLRLVELAEIPIDWLVQHPDPLPKPPRDLAIAAAAGETSPQLPGFPIPVTSFASPTSMIFDSGVVQVQARAEPVLAEAPAVLPDIDWLVQYPDPVRRLPSLVGEQYASDPTTPLTDLDWLVESAVVVRPPLRVVPGESFFLRFVELSEIAIDWLVQQPDPVRRLPELVPEAYAFTRVVELSEIAIDWLVQHPDPRRRPPELVNEGYVSFTRLVELSEITIDWLVQHPDPILPLPVPPSQSVLVEFGVPVPPAVPDIDFIVQHPDPLPKPLPTNTEPELAFEHEDLIPAPDWLMQHPDPIQELHRPSTEPVQPELSEAPPLAVFDWWIQLSDPIQPEPQRLGEYVLGELVEIPIDSWLRPASQPVLPLPPRPEGYAFVEDFVAAPVLLQWFVQYPDPQFITPPLTGELFVFDFAAPIGFVFVLRECLSLWQMVDRRLWPSGAAPSGYFNIVEEAVPSGFVKPSEEPEESTSLWKI